MLIKLLNDSSSQNIIPRTALGLERGLLKGTNYDDENH